ncbi:MAG TPA: S8 family serine peptidase, partial [Caulobacteraceae bacterium]
GRASNATTPNPPKRAAPSESPSRAETTNGSAEAKRAAAGVGERRKRRYLIAVRPLPGFAPMSADIIHDTLKGMDDVEILRRIRPKGLKGLGAGAHPGAQEIFVARMDETRAQNLRQSAPPHVVIEPDGVLAAGEPILPAPLAAGRATPTPRARREVRLQVVGEGDKPLASAGVTIFGRGLFGFQGITDQSGTANVTIFDAEAELEDVPAVYVQPTADHWERLIARPKLHAAEPNLVKLEPLRPKGAEKRVGWGSQLMGLDGRAAELTGSGVKIGLIDSGCDTSHASLRHVTHGVDLTGNGGREWTRDEIGQGTHCAGIIAGTDGSGVRGIAPGAEIHVFKLSPGGHFSDLIEALDQCIERQIDIVHLGLVTDQYSELVAQKILEARLKGVACVAAAGDEGGPVRYPARLPGVLSVAAIGRLAEFPQETRHALTAIPELIGPTGLFATNFSGAGPEIDVCGPGVAVVSSAPGGGLAARDGTAIAAAHVVGFAAVILAHHPLFRGAYAQRGEQRVKALFDLVRGSAMPPVFDPTRVGAGLPDLQRVPGLGAAADRDAWNRAAPHPGAFATAKDGQATVPAGVLSGGLAGAMALMQLRAVGLL